MLTALVSILYYIAVLVWSVAYFLFLLVLFVFTAPFDSERRVLHKASKFWAVSVFLMNPLWRLKVTGKENIDPNGRYVVTVNHQSMLDIPLMYSLPYLNFKWVAKKGVYKWPMFGVVLLLHGDIAVDDKGSVRMTKFFMKKGLERLRKGTSIIIFPEGSRSCDGEIHNFKEGAFLLAKEAGVPILPCVIDGAKTFVKGWRVQRNSFQVRITSPVSAEVVEQKTTRELLNIVRERTIAELIATRGE